MPPVSTLPLLKRPARRRYRYVVPGHSSYSPPPSPRIDSALWLVILAAACLAAWTYTQFLAVQRHLWPFCVHDRNSHYCLGLELGLDLRQFNLVQLLSDLDGTRVWGPLHGLLVGLVTAIAGPDYRLAVLPSLLAWIGTAVFGFLLARRCAPAGGTLAGLAAAVLILGSPGHRAFATDVMLESLGACLSLLVLYLYLVTLQERTAWGGAALGAALTALFLLKYNYWLLVLFALAASHLSGGVLGYLRMTWTFLKSTSWTSWLLQQGRHPLTYPIVGLGLAAAYIKFCGGGTLVLAGQNISLQSPHNLAHLMYACLFLRGIQWWWSRGRIVLKQWEPRIRRVLYWHALPVTIWFLVPKRLTYFLWYVGPEDSGEVKTHLSDAVPLYARWLTGDYHASLLVVLLVGLMVVAGLLTWKRVRPGGKAVLIFVLLGAALILNHPNRKSRFLHTWAPALWVVAGVGLAHTIYRRQQQPYGGIQPLAGAACLVGLVALHMPTVLTAAAAPEGGPVPSQSSTLDLTDAYLPRLQGARRPAILSNMPIKSLTRWTYLTAFPNGRRPETDVKGLGTGPTVNRQRVAQWLKQSKCDAIVYIHLPPGSTFFCDLPNARDEQLVQLLLEQKELPLARRWQFPQYGAVVYLWKH